MSRTLWAIGGLGSIGVVLAGAGGFALSGAGDAAMPRHVLLGLAATLTVSLAHSWAALYLLGLGRAVAATEAEGGLPAGAAATARRVRARALPWIALALGTSIVLFTLGGATTSGTLPPAAHQGLAWAALAAQLAALFHERRALGETERLLRSGTAAGA